MCVYIYIYIYIICIYVCGSHAPQQRRASSDLTSSSQTRGSKQPPCHILPPSEIGWGLFLYVFTGSEGKHLFHRIG